MEIVAIVTPAAETECEQQPWTLNPRITVLSKTPNKTDRHRQSCSET